MTSNKVTSHPGRGLGVLCILIPIALGACGSNASNEKLDAGKRKYCDAYCLDTIVNQVSEAGGNRDTQDTGAGQIDAGLDDSGRLDSLPDRPASDIRNNDTGTLVDSGFGDDAIDGAGGGGFVDVAGDTVIGGGKEVGPESGPETRDAPAADSADGKPDVVLLADTADAAGPDIVDVPPETADLPLLTDAPPDTVGPADLPVQSDVPDAPPSVCSLGTGSSSWAKAWNGVANGKLPLQQAMTTAPDGTLWITGQYSADFNFGSGVVTYNALNGDGTTATTPTGFVAKLDPTTGLASAAWGFAKMYNNQQSPALVGVAGAASGSSGGNVGIAGSFQGEMDFTPNDSNSASGQAGLDYILTSTLRAFYAVFDGASSGAFLTPVKAHIVNLGTGVFYAFASHPTQNAFVICGKTSIAVSNWKDSGSNTGLLRNPLFLDAGVGTFGGGNFDLVVAKIDAATGNVIWGWQYGGAGDQSCESAALDADGNVIIAGDYNGDLFQLDNVADTTGTVARLFVAKLKADDGTLLNAVGFPSVDNAKASHAFALTVDGDGNIVMGGSIESSVDFHGGHVASFTGLSDAFVAKLDSSFNSLWVMSDGDAGFDQAVRSVAVSSSGDVFIGGNFKGNLPFLGLGDSTHNGADDAYAAQLASGSGSKVCAYAYGDAIGPQSVSNVAVARTAPAGLKDSVFVGGKFQNTITFGSTTFASPGNTCTVATVATDCIAGTTCEGGICVGNTPPAAGFIAHLAP